MIELVVSALFTCAALPAVLLTLRLFNVVDVPSPRSSHATLVHRGGGLACVVGASCGLVEAQLRGETLHWIALLPVLGIALVGLADDFRTLAAVPRLAAQAAAGAAAGWLVGHQLLGMLTGMLVFLISVNVVNFMDGINGISGLTLGVWGGTAVVVATVHHSPELLLIGAVTAGSALGFLPANLPTARLFLGDVGSYLFGGLVGLGILTGVRDGVPLPVLVAPLSVYLADTSHTLIRRARSHAALLSSHREHTYQRLVSEAGLPHAGVAMLTAGIAGLITMSWMPGISVLAIATTTILLALYLCSASWTARLRSAAPGRGRP